MIVAPIDARAHRILAIAAADGWCSVALGDHGAPPSDEVVREMPVDNFHSAVLLEMVDTVLRAADCPLATIGGVVFDGGPGGFTNLRIGCAVAQGLAFAAGVRVAAVPSLHTLAHHLAGIEPCDESLVLSDARMGEVYGASFRRVAGGVAAVRDGLGPLSMVQATAMIEQMPAGASFGGSGFDRHVALAEAARARGGRLTPGLRIHAQTMLRVADRLDRWVAAAEAAPLYVRDKVALDIDEQRNLHVADRR
ncbi:MAG: tRNA (adenosine(37)-N6)-threonylcarbamoyltransferase complex dimerization subunit type 1 TsaB [Burkholderiaceae bacterium]|nr:tRNA (adenosine(37)-N6)-threonylcarbamoyltransferase complex dimerization subunit type 1 TsaB [Burkholderiaceae bacterium]